MDRRFTRDDQYIQRRTENGSTFGRRDEEYDSYVQPRTDDRLSNRQNYDRNDQSNYYPNARQRPDEDQSIGDRRVRDHRSEDRRVRVDGPYQSRITVDNNQEVNRRINPSDQTQRPPKVDYTVNQVQSRNRGSLVIDINISVNFGGGRTPQVITTTNNIPSRSSPIRSTAIIEDVGYVDLDIRSPERTARLATDGLIRLSPSKQAANDNDK